jgi:hypothetical protein
MFHLNQVVVQHFLHTFAATEVSMLEESSKIIWNNNLANSNTFMDASSKESLREGNFNVSSYILVAITFAVLFCRIKGLFAESPLEVPLRR